MKLLIAIPALNEEGSIDSIIRRSLESANYIATNSPITEVAVCVVSDGSTDRTVERALAYANSIKLIVFEKNRGYGAAIKEAWMHSDADLLGFLDADGTCDPNFFATLCTAAVQHEADVVLGCRMNAESKMPLIRRIGNSAFAVLLNIVSSKRVRDTASGMRVVRRSSLEKLLPLPDGLHFTPAMSARALLSSSVKIMELDMPYKERMGQSKLRVIKDGFRFLRVILETALLYRPSRPLNLIALGLFVVACGIMLKPVAHYLQTRTVAEWMIYRFVTSQLLATTACLVVSASYLTSKMVGIALADETHTNHPTWMSALFSGRAFWYLIVVCCLCAGALVASSFVQLITTGNVYAHWSRFVAMSFFLSVAIDLAITRTAGFVLDMVDGRLKFLGTIRTRG